ncbi:EF-hand domain-containing protein [Nocardia sp. CA-120079]|uniref:EF-hand domain-containing protein n=1 Tax=Nocardia sp. CA-120079 TaxID=3239974 RepID=UPI003D951C4E
MRGSLPGRIRCRTGRRPYRGHRCRCGLHGLRYHGDGKISVEELGSLIRHVGAGLIDEPAESLLAAADTDGDGFPSPSEFRALLNFLSR